ncbi:hypothetical protein OAS76_03370 [Nitrosopumilus sp.]|nr:hypothetical protein [Nitrosopumilus sp.]
MNSNLKISLSVLIAFLISFSLLIIFVIMNPLESEDGVFIFGTPDEDDQLKFYSQDFEPDEKKIFIFGSSMVWSLNPDLIEDNLKKNQLDYKVYNLGIGGSKPENIEPVIDMIISAQPDVVAYGVADRDFITDQWIGKEKEKPTQILPEPSNYFGELFEFIKNILNLDTTFLDAPQSNVIHVLRGPLKSDLMGIVSDEEIKKGKEVEIYLEDLPSVHENQNVKSLNNIITKLQENNIHVIIFVPPVHKYHIEHLSENQQNYFNNVLNTISYTSKIYIYSLYDYYRSLNVWYDFIHVTTNTGFTDYSDDFSNILIKELRS